MRGSDDIKMGGVEDEDMHVESSDDDDLSVLDDEGTY